MQNYLLNLTLFMLAVIILPSDASENDTSQDHETSSSAILTGGLPELTNLPASWEPVVFFGEDTGLVLVTTGVVSNPDSAQAYKSKYVYPDNIRYELSGRACRALYIHAPIYVSQTAIGPRLISAQKTIISGICEGVSDIHWRWSNEVKFTLK